MRVSKFASVAFGLGLAVAVSPLCVNAEDAAQSVAPPKPYPDGINCIWKPSLRSGYYQVVDDRHMVLEAAGKKFYLLTLSRICQNLDEGFELAIDGSGGQLCGPGDSIVTSRDRCMIQYLEPVANTAEAKAIVKARKAARAER